MLWRLGRPKICGRQNGHAGEPMVYVLVQKPTGSRPKKNHHCSPNPKAGRDQCPSLFSQARGIPSYLAFLFYSDLQLIGWEPPTSGWQSVLVNSNVSLIQRLPHRHIQNDVLPNIWAACSPVKLPHKINYHIGKTGVDHWKENNQPSIAIFSFEFKQMNSGCTQWRVILYLSCAYSIMNMACYCSSCVYDYTIHCFVSPLKHSLFISSLSIQHKA